MYDVVWYIADGEHRGTFLASAAGRRAAVDRAARKLDEGLDLDSRTTIFKIHGAVDRVSSDNDSFVITEDDYINFFGKTDPWNQIPAIPPPR